MDMSSQDRLKKSFCDDCSISSTLFFTIFNAAQEKPGDPSTLFRYFLKVSLDGIQHLTAVRRKLYALHEYPARVRQKIISRLE